MGYILYGSTFSKLNEFKLGKPKFYITAKSHPMSLILSALKRWNDNAVKIPGGYSLSSMTGWCGGQGSDMTIEIISS